MNWKAIHNFGGYILGVSLTFTLGEEFGWAWWRTAMLSLVGGYFGFIIYALGYYLMWDKDEPKPKRTALKKPDGSFKL